MQRWEGHVALVTGASMGTGAGICRALLQRGMMVVGCARSVDKIKAIAQEDAMKNSPGRLVAIKCDLTKESDILSMFQEIRQIYGRVDICINNAGIGCGEPLLTGSSSEFRNMLDMNVMALCICSQLAVQLMQENGGDGQIIHISRYPGKTRINSLRTTVMEASHPLRIVQHAAVLKELTLKRVKIDDSILGHKISTACPGAHFYCGTKSMVRALTEGLRKELKASKSRIRVACINPVIVETEHFADNWKKDPTKDSIRFNDYFVPLQLKDIADSVIHILSAPAHVEIQDVFVQSIENTFL